MTTRRQLSLNLTCAYEIFPNEKYKKILVLADENLSLNRWILWLLKSRDWGEEELEAAL